MVQAVESTKYETGRQALGSHPYKLALVFSGVELVAKVFFVDHLYVDGRTISIPEFSWYMSGDNAIDVRFSAHKAIEAEVERRLRLSGVVSKYTDTFAQAPLYWDLQSTYESTVDELPEEGTGCIAREYPNILAEEQLNLF